MSERRPREEIINECVQRLLDGERLDDVLLAYPGMAAELLPELQSAQPLVQYAPPDAPQAARAAAMSRMLAHVEAARRARKPHPVLAWIAVVRARPLAYQALAALGALALFGALGIGASAATGTAPEPVRVLFRLENGPDRVMIDGTVTSIDADGAVVRTPSGLRTALFGPSTRFVVGPGPAGWRDVHPGDAVEVDGTPRDDGGVDADQVRVRVAATPPQPTVPAAAPAPRSESDATHASSTSAASPTAEAREPDGGLATPESGGGAESTASPEPTHADGNHEATATPASDEHHDGADATPTSASAQGGESGDGGH